MQISNMFKSTVTTLLVLALAAATQAKLCLWHNNWYKSVVVYDQNVQDWNGCRYWNWHAQNLNTFSSAVGYIKYVCWKEPLKEIGFILQSDLDDFPDRFFLNSCQGFGGSHMYEYLTGSGWTCWDTQTTKNYCQQVGIPLLGI
ncbi:hypothetical protein HDU96_009885 [Phlyctochytrium bullatum]|nr:hypothetical protein HDU96_009885 [Phlyctochytrium bullatum]